MSEEIKVQSSNGNVFTDLGLANSEELLIKAELVQQISNLINNLINAKGLTQTEAAKILGVDQPKVSALLNGRLSGFSTERLFRFLNALGSDVEIALKPDGLPTASQCLEFRTRLHLDAANGKHVQASGSLHLPNGQRRSG